MGLILVASCFVSILVLRKCHLNSRIRHPDLKKKVHLVKKLLINVGRKMADDVKSDCLFSLSTMWARWRCLGCCACHSHSCRH